MDGRDQGSQELTCSFSTWPTEVVKDSFGTSEEKQPLGTLSGTVNRRKVRILGSLVIDRLESRGQNKGFMVLKKKQNKQTKHAHECKSWVRLTPY